jgi:hypothetical protein
MFETTYTPVKRFIKIGNHLFDADDILSVSCDVGEDVDKYNFTIYSRSNGRYDVTADSWDIDDVAESLRQVGIDVGYPGS